MYMRSWPRDSCRCDPLARPSTSFVDNTIDLSWQKFPSPEFETKFVLELPGRPITLCVGQVEGSSIRSAVSMELRLVTDRQTDTDRQTWHYAALA